MRSSLSAIVSPIVSFCLLMVGIMLAGCATRSQDVVTAYVSPMQYQNYSCAQLREEAARVTVGGIGRPVAMPVSAAARVVVRVASVNMAKFASGEAFAAVVV